MALADSHSRLLSAIDDYGEFGRKQNRKEGVVRGLEMLNESLSAAMERRRRKKEREEEIKIRERERAEDKTFALEQDMVNRQTAEIEENAQSARKRQEKKREEEELNAKIEPHLPVVKQVRELLAQADSSFDDPIAKHQYLTQANHLTYDLPKEVTDKYPWLDNIGKDKKSLESEIAADKKEAAREAREAAKEEAKNKPKPLGPAQQRLWDELGRKADATQDEDEKLGFYALQTAVEQGEALTSVIKEMREMGAGSEELGTGKDALSATAITKPSDEFVDASEVKALSPRVLAQIAIAKDLGIPIDEESVMKNPASLEPMTTGARISKKKFAAVMDAYAELEASGTTEDPAAVRQALDEAYQSYGIPVERGGVKKSVSERIMSGDGVPEDQEEAIDPEELRSEIETKYPDIYDLLRDDDGTIAEAIDDEYGVSGLADYLMLNQVSSATTGRSFLAR